MKHNAGFTLIEIIVTITITAIAGALFVAFMGTSLTQSSLPISQVKSQYKLAQQMEEITSEYRKALAAGTLSLATLQTYAATKGNYYSAGYITLTSTDSSYTTQTQLLMVTLKVVDQTTIIPGEQTLVAIFTQ
jgi:prepilin-type N-terminal cleavage/methylation domain-containing protein